jgi:hypothetical protein
MEEGYNTMVLDLYFVIMEKSTFSTFQMANSGGCTSSIFAPHLFVTPHPWIKVEHLC